MCKLNLVLLKENFTIHRFTPNSKIPIEILSGIYWLSKTEDEISIVCDSLIQLNSDKQDANWSALKVVGPLDFNQVGIIADISGLLAVEGIPIFVISTFDTDYFLIKTSMIVQAIKTLNLQGYSILF